jgi:endonuclease/exonuclease/phosphatase family metal-dependent hydrolase
VSPLRIATFNLLYANRDVGSGSWSERRALVRLAIEGARPDVLGLQEVFPSGLEDLTQVLGDLSLVPGPSTGPARWFDLSAAGEFVLRTIRTRRITRVSGSTSSEHGTTGEHQPIAFRSTRLRPLESGAFWISSHPNRPGSMLPLAPTPMMVHWVRFDLVDGRGTALVCNAHFGHAPWHHGPAARVVAEQVGSILGAHSPELVPPGGRDASVFLIGDFNAGPSTGLVRTLTSGAGGGFVDAVAAAPEHTGPSHTFHWGVGSKRLGLTLDHVLARGPFHPRRAEVIDVHDGRLYPSDHYPLAVEFEDSRPAQS